MDMPPAALAQGLDTERIDSVMKITDFTGF